MSYCSRIRDDKKSERFPELNFVSLNHTLHLNMYKAKATQRNLLITDSFEFPNSKIEKLTQKVPERERRNIFLLVLKLSSPPLPRHTHY